MHPAGRIRRIGELPALLDGLDETLLWRRSHASTRSRLAWHLTGQYDHLAGWEARTRPDEDGFVDRFAALSTEATARTVQRRGRSLNR